MHKPEKPSLIGDINYKISSFINAFTLVVFAALLHYLEEKAADAGATLVTFQARENAVAFYQRYGYEVVEKTHLLFGEIQHYKMQKRL